MSVTEITGTKNAPNKQERTRTLDASYYTKDDVLEREKSELFFKSWQFVCHESILSNAGQFATFSLFGQDFFLIKSTDESLKAYFNVCPHRGHQLLKGQGKKSRISCPYHAWTFTLDGKLMGARGVKENPLIEKSDICLFEIKVDTLLGFVFVNFDLDAEPLNTFYPGLAEQVLAVCPDIHKMVLMGDSEDFGHTYKCKSNWKVMLDNYLECYHCQMAHPEFNDMMDITESSFSIHPNFTHQIAPTAMKAETKAFPLNLEHDVLVGNFWYMFPNTTLGQFPGARGFYISRFDPITPHETVRTSLVLEPREPTDPDAPRRDKLRSKWTNEVVAREDQELCESVQRGMQLKAFKSGWYITDPSNHGISEHAMRYFHDLYLDHMRQLER